MTAGAFPQAAGEKRESKLVFIGKNLDHAGLKKSFAECKFMPEKKQKSLRFAVGDKVSCNTGEGWKEGSVVKLMYREKGMPAGMVAPYQVKLDSGPCTFPVPSLYLPCTFLTGEARLRTLDLRPRGRGLGVPEGVGRQGGRGVVRSPSRPTLRMRRG
jgi:hypothetical protein